ncbi:hypothetical protein GGF44_006714 [Coemansia sp. RSA 1694]|nr:hypothetical protein GGF44_006714 [Coemansia sp. RSA 1694]
MRFYIVFAAFSCLLALCSSTYVAIFNGTARKNYEALDTACHPAGPGSTGNRNQVSISGTATYFYADNDCSNLVAIGYHTNGAWQTVARPIRSFRSTNTW